MTVYKYLLGSFSLMITLAATPGRAQDLQYERGLEAIQKIAGCYLIDYSYAETESLKEGYLRDPRVYDVNKDKSVKEWIYVEEISPARMRLQHILFMTDLNGTPDEEAILKHQAEDWEYNASFLYEFTSPSHWRVQDLTSRRGEWTRRVTNLDDGLRYQCSSAWSLNTYFPEWSCENYAPIPGRETRDMGRKDYNALQRFTRLVVYGTSWLERQENTKVIDQSGTRVPLAKEVGKNWYVRLPDSECRIAQDFVQPRSAFWSLLRETWDDVLLSGDQTFIERTIPREAPRFVKILEIENLYSSKNLNDPEIRKEAKTAILKVISNYRVPG